MIEGGRPVRKVGRPRETLLSRRGQSHLVGIILLIAVVIIVVSSAGAVLLSNWESTSSDQPNVDVTSNLSTTELRIAHLGGDEVPAGEITVRLEGAVTARRSLEAFDTQAGPAFGRGTVWTDDPAIDPTASGVVDVVVVHEPSNTILHEQSHTI
jgi:FlaG/FlaF family flagellin (archaellin)